DRMHALGASRWRVHHLDCLAAEVAAHDRLAPRSQRWLVDIELIRIHSALHDSLAQSIRGSDEDHVAEAGVSIECEHHTARAKVAANHVLYTDRQCDLAVIEAVMHAIGDSAVIE